MKATAQGKRMLVICPFPENIAAGQRLKYEQYFDDWRAMGYDITVSSYMDMAMWNVAYVKGRYAAKVFGVIRGHMRRLRDLFRIGHYDVVYLFMWATPFGTSIIERLYRRLARRLIYDVEDNILIQQAMPSTLNPNRIMRYLKGDGKARFLIAHADHIIASSPWLADYCRERNLADKATYISSSVDTDRFLPASPYSNDKTVTIGWTGTFSTRVFLDQLRGVFQELAKRVPFKLCVIGNFDYQLEGVDLEVIQWTAEHEVRDLQTFDIGVYPLPVDDWVLGKSGLKAIQYMAFGLPAVATEVGTSPMLIRHGENGMLVTTDEDWLAALEMLVTDPDMRRRLGEQARRDAVARFSIQAVAQDYRNVLDDVMKRVPS